jgi:hypothetical protein
MKRIKSAVFKKYCYDDHSEENEIGLVHGKHRIEWEIDGECTYNVK